jgi:hypothetical protein
VKYKRKKRRYLISEYRPAEFYGLLEVQICRRHLTVSGQGRLAKLQQQGNCFARKKTV